MLCRLQMFIPYFLIRLQRYLANRAFKSACSCIDCLWMVDTALCALVAKKRTYVSHSERGENGMKCLSKLNDVVQRGVVID